MTHKSSSNSDKHPYLRLNFWNSKEYFQTWLQNLNQREKKLSNLIQK